MSRDLRVSADVARLLPAPMLAQVQATIDDPDNVCCICDGLIEGPSAELVVFTDGEATLVKLAHSDCMASGVHELPGVRALFDARAASGEGFGLATLLGLRESEPRALIFLEPELLAARPDQDPLELYATALGLEPIAGPVEEIEPDASGAFTIEPTGEGLQLRTRYGLDTVPAAPEELAKWLEAAEGKAVVIVARGLGLSRPEPPVEEALALRPAWGGVAEIVT